MEEKGATGKMIRENHSLMDGTKRKGGQVGRGESECR